MSYVIKPIFTFILSCAEKETKIMPILITSMKLLG